MHSGSLIIESSKGIDVDLPSTRCMANGILSADDHQAFNDIVDAKTKARKLMALLHAGQKPQAFAVLHQTLAETAENGLADRRDTPTTCKWNSSDV
jgi:hypothetical protein